MAGHVKRANKLHDGIISLIDMKMAETDLPTISQALKSLEGLHECMGKLAEAPAGSEAEQELGKLKDARKKLIEWVDTEFQPKADFMKVLEGIKSHVASEFVGDASAGLDSLAGMYQGDPPTLPESSEHPAGEVFLTRCPLVWNIDFVLSCLVLSCLVLSHCRKLRSYKLK